MDLLDTLSKFHSTISGNEKSLQLISYTSKLFDFLFPDSTMKPTFGNIQSLSSDACYAYRLFGSFSNLKGLINSIASPNRSLVDNLSIVQNLSMVFLISQIKGNILPM